MSKPRSDPIIEKLNTLIKITVASTLKDESKEDRILILTDLGIPRKEVADILGTSVQYVDNVKSQAKKKKSKKTPRTKSKELGAVEKRDEQKAV
jgi:5S rRNA maturation endonuclease (ribonuclease M5)